MKDDIEFYGMDEIIEIGDDSFLDICPDCLSDDTLRMTGANSEGVLFRYRTCLICGWSYINREQFTRMVHGVIGT